ncbi:B12-binding domain-containing radical SAM protein [Polyangium spumosum]|uniref:Radical SAM protein n=1 Tax=Polyangium spumosum TaxID=889282 RepID=A0A6N7PTU3_9BACT|nr:radical SAM protein [Polyangium spumosum]MRG94997.1 radical SAM protein [Polyangium spumosum]
MTASVPRPRDVLFVLPPDFSAPEAHLVFRFPPLGPAVVAASMASLGLVGRAVDLALDLVKAPLDLDVAPLVAPALVERHLAGERDARIDVVMDGIFERLDEPGRGVDLVAVSIDRGSQVPFVAVLTCEMKRRWGKRIIVGGVAVEHLRALLETSGAIGADIVTNASTPAQIRRAFAALLDLPEHRRGGPLEPNTEIVTLVRGGMRKAPSPADWPAPDFSIYDLDLYRRDIVRAEGATYPAYRGELGASLVLPYFFTFECQFSCAFCQTGGTQEHKPIDQVVRELAELSERWQTREFLFFNAQANLLAAELSRALLAARLDLRWSDSYRVRPSEPGDLELMARAGCAGLTIGVESASARVLKAMVKGHRPEQATEMVLEAHRHEIMVRVNLLSCFPGETRAEFEETRDWIRQNAFAIDDLAPSSFYLTADSPIGRKPERYGVRVRGPRSLEGEGRFRKSPDSLMYDEIGGLTWEERAPMLEESEMMLRSAWLEGRASRGGLGGFSPSSMLGLRRHFETKAEIYSFLSRCRGGAHRLEEEARAPETSAEVIPSILRASLPKLLAPRWADAAMARAFAAAFRAAAPSLAVRLREGDTAHVVLWSDGRFLFFRGAVRRGSDDQVRSFMVEEPLGAPPPEGIAQGSSFEVLTFRLDPRRPRAMP